MNQKLPPPPMAAKSLPTPVVQQPTNGFSVSSGRVNGPQRVVIYGPGGIGKSTLAALAPAAVFIDIESGTKDLDCPRVDGINTYADLRAVLQSTALDSYQTVVLDSATRAEEFAATHVLANVTTESGARSPSIEGYGWGKGYQHIFDAFLHMLADLDSQVRRGRNVVLIAHDCVNDVPNPMGENFIRFEPHLQAPKSGKGSVRNRVVQWADHVLFLGYDVIAKGGKGKGAGTRTIYPNEMPDHVAKSRRISDPMPFNDATDGAIWPLILGGGK